VGQASWPVWAFFSIRLEPLSVRRSALERFFGNGTKWLELPAIHLCYLWPNMVLMQPARMWSIDMKIPAPRKIRVWLRPRIVLRACAALALAAAAQAADYTVFVGTYTRTPESKGIYSLHFDSATGHLTSPSLAVETSNPSFLATRGKYLYAVNENQNGSVSAFAIDGARLTLINSVPARGSTTAHLAFDRTGKWLFVANYGNGTVAVFPIHDDGSLGEASSVVQQTGSSVNQQRQAGPHAHVVVPSPDNHFLLVADLGADKVFIHRFDASKGSLTEAGAATLPPGSGPRHLAFTPNGRFVYVASELAATVTAFRWDASGPKLDPLGSLSMLPADYTGTKSAAEIVVHPSGRFVYASNRGHDSIAMFRIGSDGKLTALGQVPTEGKTPRNFAIDPSGNFLLAANQDSGSIVVFRIDSKTGLLKPTGDRVPVPSPVCIIFVGG
jgi:6-phosphogluconolactonase